MEFDTAPQHIQSYITQDLSPSYDPAMLENNMAEIADEFVRLTPMEAAAYTSQLLTEEEMSDAEMAVLFEQFAKKLDAGQLVGVAVGLSNTPGRALDLGNAINQLTPAENFGNVPGKREAFTQATSFLMMQALSQIAINQHAAAYPAPLQMEGRESITSMVTKVMGLNPDQLSEAQMEQVNAISARIFEVGGKNAQVSVVPVIYSISGEESTLVKQVLFKVQDADGEPHYISQVSGRDYSSIDDFCSDYRPESGLPPSGVTMSTLSEGNLSFDEQGNAKVATRDAHQEGAFAEFRRTMNVDLTLGGIGLLAGGTLLLAATSWVTVPAALVTAAGYALAGAGAWGAATGAERLIDRGTHGQTVNPTQNLDVALDYANVTLSVTGLTEIAAVSNAARLPALAQVMRSPLVHYGQLAGNGASLSGGAYVLYESSDTMSDAEFGTHAGMTTLNAALMLSGVAISVSAKVPTTPPARSTMTPPSPTPSVAPEPTVLAPATTPTPAATAAAPVTVATPVAPNRSSVYFLDDGRPTYGTLPMRLERGTELTLAGGRESGPELGGVPVGTASRKNLQLGEIVQEGLVDPHDHPHTENIRGYNTMDTVAMHFADFVRNLGPQTHLVLSAIPQALNKGCCPAQPYYLSKNLSTQTNPLDPVMVYLLPGGFVKFPEDHLIQGKYGEPVPFLKGTYKLEDLNLNPQTRPPTFPTHGQQVAYINFIPEATLPLDGSVRMRDLIDFYAEAVITQPDIAPKISLGVTSVSPRLANGGDEILNVMAYMVQAHPEVNFKVAGLGETNFFNKEAVEYMVNLSGENPHSMENADKFLGFLNDNLPGSMAVIHMDAGRSIESGIAGSQKRLLFSGETEYTNVDRIIELAHKYPDVNFVWAHAGGLSRSGKPGIYYDVHGKPTSHTEMLKYVLDSAPNIQVDMSWGTVAEKVVADNIANQNWASPSGGGIMNKYFNRFIYGSDAVGQDMGSYMEPLKRYHDGGIINNLRFPELFLRENGMRTIDSGIHAFDNYMSTHLQELKDRVLTGAWNIHSPSQHPPVPGR